MKNFARFFWTIVVAFFLVMVNSAYSGDSAKLSAKNNEWFGSFYKAVKELDSQQAYDICSFILKRLVLGKYNPKTGKIDALENKKISNPIFLVLITKEEKKDPYWKKILSASPAQFVPATRAIVIDDSISYSENARVLVFARVCWIAYAMCNGQYDQGTEWCSQAFLTRFLEFFGESGYVNFAYDIAGRFLKEIPEDWEHDFKLQVSKRYYEELWNFLWVVASEEERQFVEECFKIHLAFIMIENYDEGMGNISLLKAEYIKSLSLPEEESSKVDYNCLYRRR